MEPFVPASLPPVEQIEVVDLRGRRATLWREFVETGVAGRGVLVEGEAVQRVAALWRALPAREPARCHIPPFGLRFRAGGGVVCQASICWACNNIYGKAGEAGWGYAFDATAGVSRELYEVLEGVMGPGAASGSGARGPWGRVRDWLFGSK